MACTPKYDAGAESLPKVPPCVRLRRLIKMHAGRCNGGVERHYDVGRITYMPNKFLGAWDLKPIVSGARRGGEALARRTNNTIVFLDLENTRTNVNLEV